MSFFEKLFKKKYPKNKIDTDEDPIDVYAGPEPDEPEDPDGSDDKPVGMAEKKGPPLSKVYAGPEIPKKPKNDSQPIKCVYAGPKGKRPKRPPIEGVYAGPRQMQKKSEPMECVYAGPEYFAPKDDTELLVICEKCGAENKFGAETCEKCGEKL